VTDETGPAGDHAAGSDLELCEERRVSLPPDVILVTAECAGFPTITIGSLVVEGATAWRRAVAMAGAVVSERQRLLELLGAPWASDELLATEAARDRLRAWYAAGRPVPTVDRLVRELRYLGDAEIRAIALEALHEIPPPVTDFLLDHALICGVGWSARGWCIRAALGAPSVLILLSGASHDRDDLRDYLKHEAAHAWLELVPAAPMPAEDVYNESAFALLTAAARPELMRDVLADEAASERRADALARSWGARLTCSDRHATDYTRREAAALAARFGAR
jgi:hypothetical protein